MKFLLTLSLLLGAIAPLPASDRSSEPLTGQIGFDRLRVENIIVGIEPHEREIPQDLVIDMRASFDLSQVVDNDDLKSTVDYVKLGELVSRNATEGRYCYIDRLAIDTLLQVFQTYPEVEQASIKIQKEAAIPQAKSGGLLELSLTREDLFKPGQESAIMGKIGFDQLLVHTVIGDLPLERENAQDLLVDVRAAVDLRTLIETGKLESTVNYVEVASLFEKVAKEGEYQMIETLAVIFLSELYAQFPQIKEADVQITKPGTLPGYPFKTDAVTHVHLKNPNR